MKALKITEKLKLIEKYCMSPLAKKEYIKLRKDYKHWNISVIDLVVGFNELQAKRFTSWFSRDDIPKPSSITRKK